jgi:quercetin dioxygenase-like cupin family protein
MRTEKGSIIGRSQDARARTFHGVDIDVLVAGSEAMVSKMRYKEGDKVPVHSHPNSQSG